MKKENDYVKKFMKSLNSHYVSKFDVRDALFGGRTEILKLY